MFVLAAFAAAQLAFSSGEYEAVLFLTRDDPPAGHEVERFYMRAVAAHQLRDRGTAIEAAEAAIDWFGPAEKRHVVLSYLILEDCKTWKADLGDTGRKMKEVSGRLDTARGGPITQAKQKAILDDLDERIKQMEDDEKKAAASAQAQAAKAKPTGQSELPNEGPSAGKVDGELTLPSPEAWGKLPEAERAKVAQRWVDQCPAKYRAEYEAYVKQLQSAPRR